ncbi:MAG: hypothetical protein GEU75_11925 [Dehalococcoidia bacterium]|nr:hypothetical protein [Dehalococcoidia bacterium]
MRIAAVYLSHFVYLAELRRRPDLEGVDLIVGDGEPPRRVLDCSPWLAELGVFRGMPLRQALGRSPGLLCLAPDFPFYEDTWESALDALWQISPEVEDGGPGECYLNVGGLVPHYGSENLIGEAIRRILAERSFDPAVGIAEGKFPARAAAVVRLDDVVVLPRDQEARFLATLGVELLPLEPSLLDRLHLLGLDQIGDLAGFPLSSLLSQFGSGGRLIWELANGVDNRPLLSRQPLPSLDEWLSFEGPVSTIEVLIAAAKQLVSRLSLGLNGRGARQLTIRAGLSNGRTWERRIVLREAIADVERLYFVTKTALVETPPAGAVLNLGLRLAYLVGETGRQLNLGDKRNTEVLSESLRQLKARYGYSPISHCVEVEPWSVIPEDRYVLIESDG